jgi:hypothetical protein
MIPPTIGNPDERAIDLPSLDPLLPETLPI